MGKFLTDGERRMVERERWRLRLSADGYDYADTQTPPILTREYGVTFSADDNKRMVEGLSTWFGMFVKRPRDDTVKNPNDYISYAIECAEDNSLTVLGVMSVIDGMIRTEKSLPSLSKLNTAFSDLRASADSLARLRKSAELQFRELSKQIVDTLMATEDQIRTIVPEFPTADVICAAWEKVMEAPPGITGAGDRDEDTKFVKSLCEGLYGGEYAVAYGLLNLTIAATAPKEKFDTVERLVIEQRPEDFDAEDSGIDKPEMWRNAVQQAESLPDELDENLSLAFNFYNEFEYRERANNYWSKYHGHETVSQVVEF